MATIQKPITKIQEAASSGDTWFFRSGYMNEVGEKLFSAYKDSTQFYVLNDSANERVLLNDSGYKLTASWDSSASGNFVFGVYESKLSRGFKEKYFAFFHKIDFSSATVAQRTLSLRFERGFSDDHKNPCPLILKLTLSSGTSYSSGTANDDGYIPFFAFESSSSSTQSGSSIGKNKRLGWIYTYISSSESTSNISRITSGVRASLYNLRTRVQFSSLLSDGTSPTNNIPIVIADMNNPRKEHAGSKTNPNEYNQTYSESCYIPKTISTIYTGCETNSSVSPALTYQVSTIGYADATISSTDYNHFFGSPDSDGFNKTWSAAADSSITYIDSQNPWPSGADYHSIGSIQELSCGVSFLAPLKTYFYVAGSMGVSQLFPAFSSTYIQVVIHKNNGTTQTSDQYVNTYFIDDFEGTWPTTDTKTNYDFSGWYVHYTENGTDKQTKIGNSSTVLSKYVDSNNKVHVYSHFTPHTYKITYNSNGGTSVSATNYNIEQSFNLASAPTRTGYDFAGWKCTTTTGGWSNTTYSAGQSIGTGHYGDITLTAQWSATSYVATFAPGSGTWSDNTTANKTSTYNITQTLSVPATISRVGYTFAGWKVTSAGGNWEANKVYNNSPQTKLEGASGKYGTVTFTAQWNINSYTLITAVNSATMGSATGGGSKNYNASCTVVATPNAGYEFVRWTFTGAKTGTSTTATTTFNMPAGDVTATATFRARTFTLTFNLNTANCPPGLSDPSALTVTYNGTYPTLDTEHNNPAWDSAHDTGEWDYEFDDWYLGNSSTKYVAGQTYTTVGNQTWNAKWTKTHQRYTVVWKDYDDSVIETDENVEYGTTPTYDGPALNRPGYTWAGRTAGWTPVVSSVTGNATYKAVYQVITYTITYSNLQGATNANPTQYNITTATINLVNPGTLTDYKFIEWRLAAEAGDVKDVEVGDKIEQIKKGSYGNITIKALWVPKLHSFEAKPGHSAADNDYFGVPIDALMTGQRYVLDMWVIGDRKDDPWKYTSTYISSDGTRYTSYPSLEPADYGDAYGPYISSYINPSESSGNGRWHCSVGKLAAGGLKNTLLADTIPTRTINNCIFPMDVWRCRIHSDNGTLHIRLTTYETVDSTEPLGTSEVTSTFKVEEGIRPIIKQGILHEGVVNIRNLNLGNNPDTVEPEDYTTTRFIGNKKSTVLINVVSSHKKNGNELLYEAVPMHFRFQLYYPGNDRSDANWESEIVTRDVPEDQIKIYTRDYNMNYDYVAGDIFVADNPFPKLEADLLNAKLRYKILDSRHNFS